MANELTLTISESFTKGNLKLSRTPGQIQVTVTGNYFVNQVQLIGTSAEDLYKGDITTPGYILAQNIGPTNYIEIGHDETGTFVADVKLLVNEWALFRCAQAAPQARANTANCSLEYSMIEA